MNCLPAIAGLAAFVCMIQVGRAQELAGDTNVNKYIKSEHGLAAGKQILALDKVLHDEAYNKLTGAEFFNNAVLVTEEPLSKDSIITVKLKTNVLNYPKSLSNVANNPPANDKYSGELHIEVPNIKILKKPGKFGFAESKEASANAISVKDFQGQNLSPKGDSSKLMNFKFVIATILDKYLEKNLVGAWPNQS